MGTNTAKRRIATGLFIAMVAILALAACSGEEAPPVGEVAAPVIVAPTATTAVIEATAAPVPTKTPAPTPALEPTQKPPVVTTQNHLAESKAQPMIDFPIEITSGSPILDGDQVLVHWADFIEGSRSFAFVGGLILEFCSGGEGTWVYELGSPNYTGGKFDYELKNDPGGSWNSVVVSYKFRDQVLFDLMNSTGGAGNRIAFQAIKSGEPSNFHEALTCDPATADASVSEPFTAQMINNDSVVGATNYPAGHPLAGQDPELTNTLSVVIDGTITSTHLGEGTVAGEVTIDLTGLYSGGCSAILEGTEGTISFTAEDGDVLNMIMTTNQLCGATGEFTGVYEIVDGTGKFASAEGVLEAKSFPVQGEPSVNSVTGTIAF